jgi:hypothetical protein
MHTITTIGLDIAKSVFRVHGVRARKGDWPAPGSEDTDLGVLMEPEVGHGETEVDR